MEGPAELVPGGLAGPDDRRRQSTLHGRAYEGSAAVDHGPLVTAPGFVVDIIREAIDQTVNTKTH